MQLKLRIATTATCVGGVLLMTSSAMPASATTALYLDICLNDTRVGTARFFAWNGAPFVLVRTTDAMLADLQAQTTHTWNQRPIPVDRSALSTLSLASPTSKCVAQHAPKCAPRYAPERMWQGCGSIIERMNFRQHRHKMGSAVIQAVLLNICYRAKPALRLSESGW